METVVTNRLSPDALAGVLESVRQTGQSLALVNSSGHRFVVMPEEDYRGWQETNYLLSSSRNTRVLREARAEAPDRARNLQDVLADLSTAFA